VGADDRRTLNDYLENVREIERRIQRAESSQGDADLLLPERPAGVPFEFEEHIKLMYELLALAYQANITRVATFMVAREVSNRTYPQVGVADGHHAISHHQNRAEKMEKNVKIQTYHVSLLRHFLEKLKNTPDGDGSLLDHTVLVYGSGLSDGNIHLPQNLPIVVAGGGGSVLKGDTHVMQKGAPLANLHLTLMEKFGVQVDKLGNSTGKLEGISV
jgi:hypothetical protein